MDVIFCPNCGVKITDEAVFCPQCGTPVKQYFSNQSNAQANNPPQPQSFSNTPTNIPVQPQSFSNTPTNAPVQPQAYEVPQMPNAETNPDKPKKKEGKVKAILIAAAVVVIAVGAAAVVFFLPGKTVKVDDISLGEWNLNSEEKTYTAEIHSSTKDTFLAQVSEKKSEQDGTHLSQLIWMENGEGTVSIGAGEEPSNYYIDSYLSGEVVSPKEDFESINFLVSQVCDFNDKETGKQGTYMFYNLKFEMKKKQSGILFFVVQNTNNDKKGGVWGAAVIDGKGWYEAQNGEFAKSYPDELWLMLNHADEKIVTPKGSRSAEGMYKIERAYFVPMESLSGEDVTISDINLEKEYTTILQNNWHANVQLNNNIDGYFLYSWEQIAGGLESNMNVEHYDYEYITGGKTQMDIWQFYYKKDFDNGTLKDPEYSYHYYGYVPVKELNK